MKKILAQISALVLAFPLAANAIVVEVKYDGYVTSSNYANYGDAISGWFRFDTDDFHYDYGYYAYSDGPVVSSAGEADLSGYYTYSTDSDSVNYYDDYYYYEGANISDTSTSYCYYCDNGSYYSYSEVNHWISALTYYYGGGWLDDFEGWTDYLSSYYDNGFIQHKGYSHNGYDYYGYYNSYAYFNIDKLHISKVTEPGTLALLGLGMAGLALTRRKRLR